MVSLTIQCPAVAQESLPGQFVQVRAWPGAGVSADPLLDRPLSVAGNDPGAGTFELVVRVAGRGTSLLAATRVRQALRVTGPLGKGFPLSTWAAAGGIPVAGAAGPGGKHSVTAVLVGGWVGVAPLKFLAGSLAARGHRILFLVGARNAAELPPGGTLPGQVLTATDDGSAGHHGTVVGLLEKTLEGVSGAGAGARSPGPVIYACGPTPMLRALKASAFRLDVQAYLSLEERMACGIGACRGCAVRYVGPGTAPDDVKMVRVCHEGPVFAAGEVDLDA